MENQIEILMKNLDITKEEALDIIESDKRIDKGEKLFELTEEQKKVEKKSRSVGRKPTVYQFTPRQRKADDTKNNIMKVLIEALETHFGKIEIINPEREIEFMSEDRKFRIVLSAPRK